MWSTGLKAMGAMINKTALSILIAGEVLLSVGLGMKPQLVCAMAITLALVLVATAAFMADDDYNFPLTTILNPQAFLSLFSVFSVLAFGLLFARYYSASFTIYDTGIFSNVGYRFWQYGETFSSVLQIPSLRDHFVPILFLLSPLYGISDSFLWLPILKTVAFLLCPLILLRFGCQLFDQASERHWAYLPPMLWMVSIHLTRVLTMEFQPSTLALPLVLAAFLLAHNRRWLPLGLSLFGLLLFKENMALVWISVGMFVMTESRRGLVASILCVGGVIVGLTVFFVVIPAVGGQGSPHIGRFGPLELIGSKLYLIFSGLLSVGFLPLLAPRTLLFVLPAFALSIVSRDPQMVSYGFHYQDIGLAALFVASLVGLREFIGGKVWRAVNVPRRGFAVALFLILLVGVNCKPLTWYLVRDWPTKESIRLIAQLRLIDTTLAGDEELWTLNSMGAYFFTHRLRCITNAEAFINDAQPKVVVLSKSVSTWPLTDKEMARVRAVLTKRVEQGLMTRTNYGEAAEVFVNVKA